MVWRRGKQALTKSNSQQPPARNTVPEASSAAGSEVGVRSVGGNTATFRVSIPPGVVPGQEFQVRVNSGTRIVRVRCPRNCRGGQIIQITVPVDDVPEPPSEPQGPNFASVTIPPGIRPGQTFTVHLQGRNINVTCPVGCGPGISIRVALPPPEVVNANNIDRPPEETGRSMHNEIKTADTRIQTFEVQVPRGVRPGQSFALMAGGQRVLISCPPNAQPGQKIRFKLQTSTGQTAPTKFLKGRDGWTRTMRVSDQRLQWIRLDEDGKIVNYSGITFDVEKSAYVRHFSPNNSSGETDLTLISADRSSCASNVVDHLNKEICTSVDLAEAQSKTFEEKAAWFSGICNKLCVDWNAGHMRINVRRDHLLEDSMLAVMSLGQEELRKIWRFEFIDELGVDAGGLAREWFQLNSEKLVNPDFGLFTFSAVNQMCLQINPSSGLLNDEHLDYFRFFGRIMGKALFDRQLLPTAHLVRHMYKHLLGWPITMSDLEFIDTEVYRSLLQVKQYQESGGDVTDLYLDFTVTEEVMGESKVIELVPDGSSLEVTNENVGEFMEGNLRHRVLDVTKKQTMSILLGFYDVIPESLMTIFDFNELELLMCGKPNIDMEDWQQNTEYSGEFEICQSNHQVVDWFWQIVEDYDSSMKARLLQFSTGTSGVPSRGFSVLQGNDGNVRPFTLHGVMLDQCLYPRAHTCFNRIDLPLFTSREDLEEKLKFSVMMESTFDME
uniref:HECT-type E3 ubiquitin transferase n=1 Tax=Leptocylindrus aporus TaxID=1398097 RepID=A0A6T5VL12_9STRA|mmetsp:Transcript_1535/g.2091  ORF Transcript_1535/g.2091 Transcript_1535/m.2091 type:complete len:723 (+) Transcript_1535:147-2315(+)